MQICPKCNRQYESAVSFCEYDGTRLAGNDSLAAPADPVSSKATAAGLGKRARSAADDPAQNPKCSSKNPSAPATNAKPTDTTAANWHAEYKEFTGSDDDSKKSRKPVSRETKVGLGLVVLLVIVVVAAFYFRAMREFRFEITFEDGHGLKVGDAVYCMGADIGEVADAGFDDGRFVASIVTGQQVASEIREDSAFFVANDKILLNKKCVHIIVLDPASAPLTKGAIVKGEDSAVKYYFTLLKREGGKEIQRAIQEMRSVFELPGGGFQDILKGLGG